MKKRTLWVFAALVALCGALIGCGGGDEAYSLRYTYGEEYVIEARMGEEYAIAEIPQKDGYVFDGLYDAERGGVKYVGADGKSVRPFADGKDVALYVRFVPRVCEFEFVYDEGELSTAGVRSAEYGGEVGDLPILELDAARRFDGWYTAESDGAMVADGDGKVAEGFKTMNGDSYTLDDGYGVKLYAAVSNAPVKVEFYSQSGDGKTLLDEKTVEYGTHIVEAARGVKHNGLDVTGWSTADGKPFLGELTANVELFVGCLGTFIDLDAFGSGKINVSDDRAVLLYGDADKLYESVDIAVVGGESDALVILYNAHIQGDSPNGTVCAPTGNARRLVICCMGESNGISTAVDGAAAIDAYGDVTVVGNSTLTVCGGSGANADGEGNSGGDGANAIVANSLTVEMDEKGGKLVCYGGDGGHGSDGADATGKSVGHETPLRGGVGGRGGDGGNGVSVKEFVRLNAGEVVLHGGAGGNGGNAGKGQDSSHWDREPAGAGGTGGNGGVGGCGLTCAELSVFKAVPSVYGGSGGVGGTGGRGGNASNNDFYDKTDYGGSGGVGGAGGNGGAGIYAQAIDENAYYSAQGGTGGAGGSGGSGGNGYQGVASGGDNGKRGADGGSTAK